MRLSTPMRTQAPPRGGSRNEADALTFQAERLVKDLGDKISEEDRKEIETRVEAVREALKGDDAGVIDSTKQQLADVLQRVGTRAYEAGGGGTDGGDGSTGGNGAGPEGSSRKPLPRKRGRRSRASTRRSKPS